jgi:hypothetical protein
MSAKVWPMKGNEMTIANASGRNDIATPSTPTRAVRVLVIAGGLAVFGAVLGLVVGANIGASLFPSLRNGDYLAPAIAGALVGAIVCGALGVLLARRTIRQR